ncbi:hypothetical protein Q9233_008807 [Columba guinea]|nr:hypothetical protein Q9233_008807 [Columba guinea]
MVPVLSAHARVTATLVLLLSTLSLAAGGKLLVVPVDGSHWLSMREVLDGLKQRGHEIVVVAPEITLHIKPTKNFVMKTYPVPFTQEELDRTFWRTGQNAFEEGSFLERFFKTHELVKNSSALFLSTCSHLLYNKELVTYLKESQFDAVFTDPFLLCGPILAEHLSLPSVFILQRLPCDLDLQATQCPRPPSYVPRAFTDHTDRMNFLQRVRNLIYDIPNYFLCNFVFQPYATLASEFLQRDVTVMDLLRQASIWLLRIDFVFQYPRPLMPNMVMVSGVTCAHKKLTQQSQARIDDHKTLASLHCEQLKGFSPEELRFFTRYTDRMALLQRTGNLLASLSSSLACSFLYSPYDRLIREFLQQEATMLDLFSHASVWLMKYDFVFEYPRPLMPNMVLIGGISCTQEKALSQVLWRYTGKVPHNLPKNVKLVKWLPQNDLLAHPKARAFITHGGSHGIYEGVCNAVPMVLMPLFGDQMDNAKRIESRGAGLMLNILEMTSQNISTALKAVINDKKYKENIKRLSELHLDRPIHPLDLAVHWVEFVMRHQGAPHLRPAAYDLNWIQYHSLDVIAFLLAVVLLSLFISLKCCLFCCRRCCSKKGRARKPTKAKSH